MKKTLRSAMLSTICMLVVAVMSLTGVTYAWFSQSTQAEVSGMTMEVGTAGAGLQVSKSANDGFGAEIEFEGNSAMQPVSTKAAETFYTATVDANNPNEIVSIAENTDENNVWTETFYLKNTGNGDLTVALDAEVFADNSSDKSFEAARIAIFEGDTLKYIYGMHDGDTYLAVVGLGTNVPMGTEKTGVIESVSETFTNDYSTIRLTAPGRDIETNEEKPAQAYTVKVWLEGQDPQCDNDAALSSFNVTLSLKVVQ